MALERTVKVFAFRLFDAAHLDSGEIAKFKATRETIESLGGQVLQGTGQDVPVDELDSQGRYQRLATGWGDLS